MSSLRIDVQPMYRCTAYVSMYSLPMYSRAPSCPSAQPLPVGAHKKGRSVGAGGEFDVAAWWSPAPGGSNCGHPALLHNYFPWLCLFLNKHCGLRK